MSIVISRQYSNEICTHMDCVEAGNFPFVDAVNVKAVKIDCTGINANGEIEFEHIQTSLADAVNYECVVLNTGWMDNHVQDWGEACYNDDEIPSFSMKILEYLAREDSKVRYVLVDSPGVHGGRAGEKHNMGDIFLVSHKIFPVEYVGGLKGLPKYFTVEFSPLDIVKSQNVLKMEIKVRD